MIKLEEGENIIYTARKHWILFVGETASLFFVAILPFALFVVPTTIFEQIFATLAVQQYGPSLFFFFWSLWLMFLWMVFVLLWTNYYLDVWLITNYRIIDIEQLGLFNRHLSSFRFDQIQDATVKVSGLLATLIGFGTVEIHTASNESFKFKGVANPNHLKERIMSEHHRVHT